MINVDVWGIFLRGRGFGWLVVVFLTEPKEASTFSMDITLCNNKNS